MSKVTQHVIPSLSGGWAVRRSGASRASRVFKTRRDAVTYARRLAQKAVSELYIHAWDGTIEQRDTFGFGAQRNKN